MAPEKISPSTWIVIAIIVAALVWYSAQSMNDDAGLCDRTPSACRDVPNPEREP